MRRIGVPEEHMINAKGNLANAYHRLGRLEEALSMRRDVYSGYCRLLGEDSRESIDTAFNYANNLFDMQRFEDAKAVLRKMTPVAQRVLGESRELTLLMRCLYARSLYEDPNATLDDLREAVTMFEEIEPTARRVLGGAHPLARWIEKSLQIARAVLRARETPSSGET